MATVRFIRDYQGKFTNHQPFAVGELADLSEAVAAVLVARGLAEYINAPDVVTINFEDGIDAEEASAAGRALQAVEPETEQGFTGRQKPAPRSGKAKHATKEPKTKRNH